MSILYKKWISHIRESKSPSKNKLFCIKSILHGSITWNINTVNVKLKAHNWFFRAADDEQLRWLSRIKARGIPLTQFIFVPFLSLFSLNLHCSSEIWYADWSIIIVTIFVLFYWKSMRNPQVFDSVSFRNEIFIPKPSSNFPKKCLA